MISRFFSFFTPKVTQNALQQIKKRTSNDVFKEMLKIARQHPSQPVSARDLLKHKLEYGGIENAMEIQKLKAASDLDLVISPRSGKNRENLFTTRENYSKQEEELLKEQSEEPWRLRTREL